jgi:ferredoxin-thioredoxin reductase catalytic subunit
MERERDPATEEEMQAWADAEAKAHGFVLNPDERQLKAVLKGLVRNRERFGARYCPCRIRTGDPEKDRTIECPCVYRGSEIAEQGRCHCNLFLAPSGKQRESP